MPSNLTDFGENALIGAIFGATVSVPATFYMALLTAAPQISDDGTLISEPPTASGYARVSFANTSSFWSAASGGVVLNIAAITFPLATADWPPVTHYAFLSASTGGNMYLYSTLQVPRVVQSGHLCKFDIGQLSLSLQGARQPILSTS
jgi:hypothetical protein